MSDIGTAQVKEAEVSLVIIRANGQVEDLGVVSRYTSNPIKNVLYKIEDFVKGRTGTLTPKHRA